MNKVLLKDEIPEEEKHLYKPMNRAQRRAYARKNKKEWKDMQKREYDRGIVREGKAQPHIQSEASGPKEENEPK
jgi:hypothetical protein